MSSTARTRFDFPRALAAFLDREEVYRELQKVTNNPLDLRNALLERAWALEPDDPADGSPLPGRERRGSNSGNKLREGGGG